MMNYRRIGKSGVLACGIIMIAFNLFYVSLMEQFGADKLLVSDGAILYTGAPHELFKSIMECLVLIVIFFGLIWLRFRSVGKPVGSEMDGS